MCSQEALERPETDTPHVIPSLDASCEEDEIIWAKNLIAEVGVGGIT